MGRGRAESVMDEFGLLLQTARKRSGLSLRALGKETGYSNAFLSQLENGVEHPGFETAILIAETLRLDLKVLAAVFMDCRGRRG